MTSLISKLRVKVLQSDIDNGVRHHPEQCPIASALRRQGYQAITVYTNRLSFLDPATGEFHFCSAPEKLTEFITFFDNSSNAEPNSFWITLS